MKLAGILKEAFEKAGVPLPEKPKKAATPVLDQRKKKVAQSDANQERKTRPRTARKKAAASQPATSASAQNGKKVTVTANGTCIFRAVCLLHRPPSNFKGMTEHGEYPYRTRSHDDCDLGRPWCANTTAAGFLRKL